jgi:hypothetical protein
MTYMPTADHECVIDALTPESTSAVVADVVSPQSNVYFTWFESGSVADVEYEYDVPVTPVAAPVGVAGVFGGLLGGGGAVLMTTENAADQPESALFESVDLAFTS